MARRGSATTDGPRVAGGRERATKPPELKNAEKPRGKLGGARPNSGRKSKAALLGLVALLDKCWTVEDREACVLKLASLARTGDMEATKLLFNYAFGKPKETKEHAGQVGITVRYVDRPIETERP
jgi:hypothetical protein